MVGGTSRTGAIYVVSDSDSEAEDGPPSSAGRGMGRSSRSIPMPWCSKQAEVGGHSTPRTRVMRLLADSSPDTSLPSFREIIQRHKSQLTERINVDVDPSRRTVDLSSANTGGSLRADSLRRTISQPENTTAAAKRRRLPSPSTAMVDVIEIESDSIVDPATSQGFGPITAEPSSPIQLHMSSSQPQQNPSRPMNKTASAPILILSSSPPCSQTHSRGAPEARDTALPPSSLPLLQSSQNRPSSPILASPTRHRTSFTKVASGLPGSSRTLQRTRSLLDALDDLPENSELEAGPSTEQANPHEALFFASQSTDDGRDAHQARYRGSAPDSTKEPPSKSNPAKEAAKAAREAKAREREMAKQAKLTRAEEQKLWKEANRLRSNKTETMREMLIDLDTGLFAPGQPLASRKDSIQSRMLEEGAAQVTLRDTIVSPPMIRFRRKVKAVWDDDQRHWKPLEHEKIVDECTAIVYVDAKEVVEVVGSSSIVEWYDDLRRRLTRSAQSTAEGKDQECQVFLIVQGLLKYYAKIRANENKAYAARIRNQLALDESDATLEQAATDLEPSRAASRGKSGAVTSTAASQEDVERALLQLKFVHRCYVIHVGALIDGVGWIHQLTSDISIRPYKALRDSHLSFSVDSSRGSAANDSFSIWSLMLQQIPRVTASIAASITTVYPTLPSLVKAYKQCPDQHHRNQLLSTIQISTNVDGTERRGNRANLGLQLSKRICAVLQNRNPDLLINNPTKD